MVLNTYLAAPSNADTDGIVWQICGHSVGGDARTATWDYGAGIERNRTQVGVWMGWANYMMQTPILIHDRYVWWVGANGSDIRLLRSQQPLSRTSGFSAFSQAVLRSLGGTPSGAGAFAGGRCFVGRTDGRISFFAIPAPSSSSVDIHFTLLNQPSGALVATGSPIVSDGNHIYYATAAGQLALYRPATDAWLLYAPASPIVAFHALGEFVLLEHANRTISLWRNGALLFAHAPLPGNLGGVSGFEVLPRERAVVIAHDARISVYRWDVQQWLWSNYTGARVISNPAYDTTTNACYGITSDGLLWGFHAPSGALLPHYPHLLYPKPTLLQQARLQAATRAGRSVSYLYITTVQGETSNTRFWWVNASFPYNRFYRDIPWTTATLREVFILGNTPDDVALAWFWPVVQSNGAPAPGFYLFDLQ